MGELGWSKFETKVTESDAYERDSSPERQLLFKLLEVYWGEGDGEPAPAFIRRAAECCRFPLAQ